MKKRNITDGHIEHLNNRLEQENHPYGKQLWRLAKYRTENHERTDLALRLIDAKALRQSCKSALEKIRDTEVAIRKVDDDATKKTLKEARDHSLIERISNDFEALNGRRPRAEEVLPVLIEQLFRSSNQVEVWKIALAFRHAAKPMPPFYPREKRMTQAKEVVNDTVENFPEEIMDAAVLDFEERFIGDEEFRDRHEEIYSKSKERGVEEEVFDESNSRGERIGEELMEVTRALQWIWHYQEVPARCEKERQRVLKRLHEEHSFMRTRPDQLREHEQDLLERREELGMSASVIVMAHELGKTFTPLPAWEEAFDELLEEAVWDQHVPFFQHLEGVLLVINNLNYDEKPSNNQVFQRTADRESRWKKNTIYRSISNHFPMYFDREKPTDANEWKAFMAGRHFRIVAPDELLRKLDMTP